MAKNNHYCETCKKMFKDMGIARHRAMHRDKKEDCTITVNGNDRYTWRYSKDRKGGV